MYTRGVNVSNSKIRISSSSLQFQCTLDTSDQEFIHSFSMQLSSTEQK